MKNSTLSIVLLSGLAMLAFSSPASAQTDSPVPYQEGLHYAEIEGAPVMETGDKVVVTEAFSYLCTHCNSIEPYVNSWKKRQPEYVEFERIPVVFGRSSWELYARGYITAEMMNVPEEAHSALMDLLWKDKKILRSMDELADFYSGFGLDKEKFLSTSRSFAVDGKLRKDQSRIQSWGIRGTPAFVLNGKYRISANSAVPSFEVMFDVVDYLVGIEAANLAQAAGDSPGADSAAESP